jgi:lipopolysaccharide export system protein LptA
MRIKTIKSREASPGVSILVRLLFVLFVFMLCLPASAQQDNEQMDITGDVMYLNEDGTRVVEGHLVIKREDMTLWADRGTYNEKKNFSSATGHVRVEMENTTLTCGYLEFYMNENRSVARIQPKIVQQIPEKKEEEGTEDKEGSKSEKNNKDEKKKEKKKEDKSQGGNTRTGVLVGREIEIYHDENRVKAVGRAILTQYTASGRNKKRSKNKKKMISKDGDLKVTAHSIEIYTDINRMVALRNVKIVNADITATGNKAVYNDKTEVLDIIGNARTWQKANIKQPDDKKDKKDKKGKKGQKEKSNEKGDKPGSKEDKDKEKPEKSEALVKSEQELEKVKKIKMEMVHINDLDGGHAEAERAVYNARDEVLDLIGSAKSWQEDGINLAQGERIRYFLKDKRSVLIDARIKHYPGSSGPGGSKKAASAKGGKKGTKKPVKKKQPKSEEEAALEALRMLD